MAKALSAIEALAGSLAKLELRARGMALCETSRACDDGMSEAERLALGTLQSETNAAFAQLRRIRESLHQGLSLLGEMSADIGAAAQVVEQRSRGRG
ncbi:hypothetical protein J2X36_002559 [Methylobacterium sp. BE186]|uniref:hypothetical protein n=1 Tax=Methylobacterium sp. BE186 TaxID=2817715 RepID=UPI002865C11A|nr:hypothetical protein [Methylobacterium sp. BE186]MDR7037808.1 hypothetical protein [Methylobacterium sp. BE186]